MGLLTKMATATRNIYRERIDFAKIKTSIPIPNLIEIQKNSYERFLQMRVLPQDREDAGLQSVFKSIFPITDLRENCSLEFVDYSIGNWECKCGRLVGLDKLGRACSFCQATIITDPRGDREIHCQKCGHLNENRPQTCETCDEPVGLKLKYDVDECQERGMTFAVPLKVTIRLVVWDKDAETGAKTIRDIKEQEVYYGDIPLMTENGTFIINGTERVIVSQLHRSPGVFFSQPEKGLFAAQIIPYRGSWVEFEFDAKNLLHVRIDRKRKFLASVFLRALGMKTDAEILKRFYKADHILVREGRLYWKVSPNIVGQKLSKGIFGPKDASGHRPEIVHAGKKITAAHLAEIQRMDVQEIEITEADLEGAFCVADIVDPRTGEVVLEGNEALSPRVLSVVLAEGSQIDAFDVFFPERDEIGPMLSMTVKKDSIKTPEESLIEIYRRMRPGDPPTLDSSRNLFEGMFLNAQKYDFSRVGRLKLNTKLGLSTPLSERIIHLEDIVAVIGFLLKLRRNPQDVDDIDHLGNRRVRSVGELLENQFRIGLVRMERAIKEKMSVYQEMATAMPHDLINAKPVMASIREFFGSSQLSQFMDQTNPLSEITHKRRLSALGPGGSRRERAGFEVRDVHPTHYGRICPIETPEGPNIGLISSLSCFARINEFGFIESPYRKVKDGRVLDYVQVTEQGESTYKVGDIVERDEMEREIGVARGKKKKPAEIEPYCFYLSAWEEDRYTIAQANARLDDAGNLMDERVEARKIGDSILAKRDEIDYVDVSPKQLVSVAASLIPFLEHDDANRALMGSNMQRQAVPLLRSEAPLVGTGMEHITVKDSGAAVVCRRAGTVDSVDSRRIIIRVEAQDGPDKGKEIGADIYNLTKFKCSNQNTSLNQKPIVKVGPARHQGHDPRRRALHRHGRAGARPQRAGGVHALARLQLRGRDPGQREAGQGGHVHLDPHRGVRDRGARHQARSRGRHARHPERLRGAAREPRRERHHPHRRFASSRATSWWARSRPRARPSSRPEEKLLRAIFGEKAGDVRDASLYCPPGIEGIVVDVKIFSRKGVEKDDRARQIEEAELFMMEKNLKDEVRILQDERDKRIENLLDGQTATADLVNLRGEKVIKKGQELTLAVLAEAAPLGHPQAARQQRGRGAARRDRRQDRAPDRGAEDALRREGEPSEARRRAAARRHQAGQGLRRHEAQAVRGRQDGRPPRQQGRHRPDPARRGHAVPAGRDAGRDRAQPARRALAHERRPDPGDTPRLGRAGARARRRDPGLRRRLRARDQGPAGQGQRAGEGAQPAAAQPAGERQDHPRRRHDRRALRAEGQRRLHLHAEAVAPGRRQDPRALDRSVLPDHAAAARRQGAVRRPALRRDGGVGARGVRRRAHPPGAADRQVGRRLRPGQDLRGDRQGRHGVQARASPSRSTS